MAFVMNIQNYIIAKFLFNDISEVYINKDINNIYNQQYIINNNQQNIINKINSSQQQHNKYVWHNIYPAFYMSFSMKI